LRLVMGQNRQVKNRDQLGEIVKYIVLVLLIGGCSNTIEQKPCIEYGYRHVEVREIERTGGRGSGMLVEIETIKHELHQVCLRTEG
jgi:hypothetical protein